MNCVEIIDYFVKIIIKLTKENEKLRIHNQELLEKNRELQKEE